MLAEASVCSSCEKRKLKQCWPECWLWEAHCTELHSIIVVRNYFSLALPSFSSDHESWSKNFWSIKLNSTQADPLCRASLKGAYYAFDHTQFLLVVFVKFSLFNVLLKALIMRWCTKMDKYEVWILCNYFYVYLVFQHGPYVKEYIQH